MEDNIQEYDVYDEKTDRNKSILFKILPYVFSVIFIILGLYLGIARGVVPTVHFGNFVEVTATVDEVLEYKQQNNQPSKFRLKFSYTYNEKEYSGRLGTELHTSKNCPIVGAQVKIKINPNSPIELAENISVNYAEMIIGFGLTLVAGIIITVQTIKLVKKGNKKEATPEEEVK